GAASSIEPSLVDWPSRRQKVIISVDQALTPFPREPDSFATELAKGGKYPRDELLELLIAYGFERDEAPGFSVRGDTITVHLDETAERELRLEFFGDELDAL